MDAELSTSDCHDWVLSPRQELRGVVERITYQPSESGYTVVRLAPESGSAGASIARGDRPVTVVGSLPDLPPDEAILA